MVCVNKEGMDRVFGEEDLDGVNINKTVHVGEKYKVVDKQDEKGLKSIGTVCCNTSEGFTE